MSRLSLTAPLCVLAIACSHGSSDEALTVTAFNAPELDLVSPSGGDWLAAGENDVSGRAAHVTDVTLNGAPVDVDGNTFTAEIDLPRGITVLELEGTDERGDTRFVREAVIAGEYGDPGRTVEDALDVRLNSSGIDIALDKVERLLVDLSLADEAVGMAVYDDSYGLLGWDAVSVTALVGGLEFSPIQLSGDPNEGHLELGVSIPNLDLWIPVSGQVFGYDFAEDAYFWASRAEVTAALTVDVDSQGKLVVEMEDPRIDLIGFGYDTSLIPGEIESWVLVDEVRSFIEDMLVEEVRVAVPPLLEEQLAGLDLSFETEMLDKQVEIEALFNHAAIDPKGIVLGADLDVHIPGNAGMSYAGYLAIPENVDAFVDRSSDVGVTISDDLFNRVLFEAWRSGMLDMTLSTEDGSLDPLMLAALGGTNGGSITVSAGLPPVVVESDGALTLQTGEINVYVSTPGGDKGDFLDLSLAITAEADMGVTGGLLGIDLDDATFSVVVRDSDWGAASNETVTAILEESLPIDTLIGVVADLEVPIPSLAGITIADARVDRDGEGFHTGIGVTLQ